MVCQQGRWPQKKWIGGSHINWRRERVSAKRLSPEGGGHKEVDWGVPHRLEKGTSANKDVGLRRGVDYEISCRLRGERNILYMGVKISP